MEDGLQCTGCGSGGFPELYGKYTKGDQTIIREGEALCEECASQRDGFESSNINQSKINE